MPNPIRFRITRFALALALGMGQRRREARPRGGVALSRRARLLHKHRGDARSR